MTNEEGEALSVLALMQEPGEYVLEMKAGLGFDRASEDELKGREEGLQREEKSIQERRRRKLSRIKRAGAY